jgi:hypothetical protein
VEDEMLYYLILGTASAVLTAVDLFYSAWYGFLNTSVVVTRDGMMLKSVKSDEHRQNRVWGQRGYRGRHDTVTLDHVIARRSSSSYMIALNTVALPIR